MTRVLVWKDKIVFFRREETKLKKRKGNGKNRTEIEIDDMLSGEDYKN
jgi:hypothetical protein